MPLSWNEIRHRAIAFSKEWRGETREAAERQSFWNEFFNVFGMRRRAVASFEEPVRKLSGDWGFIDLYLSHFMTKPLTIPVLQKEAAAFAKQESAHNEPSLFGVTDGKAVGTSPRAQTRCSGGSSTAA